MYVCAKIFHSSAAFSMLAAAFTSTVIMVRSMGHLNIIAGLVSALFIFFMYFLVTNRPTTGIFIGDYLHLIRIISGYLFSIHHYYWVLLLVYGE